ncbi:hypothetical protein [uncultured Jannaschia sp.]|uniref:hypothetical protein n=1 Tax=uncultured Jannaschia sp. TaxID=293347 RepID=UPI002630027B|nr:hypothetical protein [uncultured Jannaschia sp.]
MTAWQDGASGTGGGGAPWALARMAPTLAPVAVLWSVSSWGYYALADAPGVQAGYDDAPVLFAVYYLGWAALAFAAFRSVLTGAMTRPGIAGNAAILAPIPAAYGAFVALALPLLPEVSVWRAPPNPPEFMFASAWSYLPKSADILFQQVLVAAMVRRAYAAGMPIRAIGLMMAALSGGFHLTLALDGFTALYVARFTVAATLFGLIVPHLYLRARRGFAWTYALHWGFYAADAVITQLVLAVPPPA